VTGSGVYTAAGNKVIKRDLTTSAVLWEKDITMSNGGSPLAADVDGKLRVDCRYSRSACVPRLPVVIKPVCARFKRELF